MLENCQHHQLEHGMRRIAEYVAEQAKARRIGPVRVTWSISPDESAPPNRIMLKIATKAASRELTLNREPVEDYGRKVDVAMTEAVIREAVRKLSEPLPG
jgi:hypothetical protein